MSLIVVTGRSGEAAVDIAKREDARIRELSRHVEDLVVLEADQRWWAPPGAPPVSAPVDPDAPRSGRNRGSSLALVLRDAARDEPGTVVLLLDADLDQVRRIQPLSVKLDLPLLWWREAPLPEAVVSELRPSIAGMLTTRRPEASETDWLWALGAGLDLHTTSCIDRIPPRPPLRLVTIATSAGPEIDIVLRGLAFARGLTVDAHVVIALPPRVAAMGVGRTLERRIRDLALTRSARVAVAEPGPSLPSMLAAAHAFVDGGGDSLPVAAILAMAHGRPVISAREELGALLDEATLPLRFASDDERQLAERIRTLAAAWSEELATAGQALRDGALREHSVPAWARSVAAIVGSVRAQHRGGITPDEPSAPGNTSWSADANVRTSSPTREAMSEVGPAISPPLAEPGTTAERPALPVRHDNPRTEAASRKRRRLRRRPAADATPAAEADAATSRTEGMAETAGAPTDSVTPPDYEAGAE